MTTLSDEIATLTDDIIADRRREPVAGDASVDLALWQALDEAGLTGPDLLEVQEDGSRPVVSVMDSLAGAAADLPILEHLWLGHWLLGQAGIAATGVLVPVRGDGLTYERHGDDLIVSGEVAKVAWGSAAETFVLYLDDGTVAAVPASEVAVTAAGGMVGAPLASLTFAELRVERARFAATSVSPADVRHRLTVGRLIQIRGAAGAAIELAVEYARQRVQFGRPLAKFQAVQLRAAGMFGEFTMLDSGVNLALAGSELDASLARVDARRSVTEIHRNAHQLLGAIGVTAEHRLGFLTSRMIAWLADTGSDEQFVAEVREHIRDTGAWDVISAPLQLADSPSR